MQDLERATSGRRRVEGGSVGVQRSCSCATWRSKDRNTLCAVVPRSRHHGYLDSIFLRVPQYGFRASRLPPRPPTARSGWPSTCAAFRGCGGWRSTTRSTSRPCAPFFAGDPADAAAWAAAQSPTSARTIGPAPRSPRRSRRSRRVTARRSGAAPTRARLADAGTVAIVTGQQAGLFGGPLYTLLKAITAIRLAARVSRDHGVPVVPVFWIDAEDHDWDEIAGCGVLDADDAPRASRSQAARGRRRAPHRGAQLHRRRRRARSTDAAAPLPATEFTTRCSNRSRADYRAGPRRVGRLRPLDEPHARRLTAWSSTTRRTRPPSRLPRRCSAPNSNIPAARRSWRAGPAPRLPAAAITRRSTRPTTASRCSDLTAARRPIRDGADGFVIGDDAVPRARSLTRAPRRSPRPSAPTCCCDRWCRTRSSRRSVTSPGRASSPTWGSSARSTRSLGLPMPLFQPRATATILDAAGVRFLTATRCRSRRSRRRTSAP